MRRSVLATVIGTALACALVLTARAQTSELAPMTSAQDLGDLTPRIVNGTLTAQYPTTGVLLSSNDPDTASLLCSGTLIGCRTFLTAGHCVEGDLNPSHYAVFLQHAGFFKVSSVAMHPDYDFPVGDVAVLKLSTTVTGIRPTAINTVKSPPLNTAGTIAGFGRSGGINQDYGLKRAGSVVTAACRGGVSNTTSVCWTFMGPFGAPGSNSNTCNGDSGGPLFIDFGSGAVVAGVTSGGHGDSCFPTDTSFDANVFAYATWIAQQAGSDLNNTACGAISQVGDTGTNIVAAAGQLSASSPSATHTFQIGSGVTLLRVTMNAIDDDVSNFDLYVKAGVLPSMSDYDCKQDGSGQYGFCEFSNPTAGAWYALVNRESGSGTYQVTATTFGGPCSDASSEGQLCDDDNACTFNDRCRTGACTGSAAPSGTPCDDGNPCTPSDSCEAGACIGDTTPRSGCRAPIASDSGLFRLQDKTPGEPSKSDKLTWNWLKGSATVKSEYGDPLTDTNFDLCVYDESGTPPTLLLSQRIAGAAVCGTRACWKETNTSFKYTDKQLVNGPISAVLLKQGAEGKAKITLTGKGETLGMPALPLQPDTITVQLSNGTTCWEAHYSTPVKNQLTEYKAKAD